MMTIFFTALFVYIIPEPPIPIPDSPFPIPIFSNSPLPCIIDTVYLTI